MHGDQKSKGKIVIPIWCSAIWVTAFCSGLPVVALPAYSWSIPFIIVAAFLGVFSSSMISFCWDRTVRVAQGIADRYEWCICILWKERGVFVCSAKKLLYVSVSGVLCVGNNQLALDWYGHLSLGCRSFPGPLTVWFIATLLTNPLIIETSKNPLMLWLKIAKRWVMLIPAPARFFTLKSSLFSVCLVYTAWSLMRISHHCCSRLVLTMAGSGHG